MESHQEAQSGLLLLTERRVSDIDGKLAKSLDLEDGGLLYSGDRSRRTELESASESSAGSTGWANFNLKSVSREFRNICKLFLASPYTSLQISYGGLYHSDDGSKELESTSAAPSSWSKGWATFKRVFPNCLNIFMFCYFGPYILRISYAAIDQCVRWYSNFLMQYALICYAFGTLLGVGLKFAKGNLLATCFPERHGHRRFSYQDLQEIGAAGYWNEWVMVFGTCLWVELTASTVGRINGLNERFVEQCPGASTFTISWMHVEPATVIVILLTSVMILPMWHKSRFDVTSFGLIHLFFSNNFPWGFPVYRILVGILSNLTKLDECHKVHTKAKAALQS